MNNGRPLQLCELFPREKSVITWFCVIINYRTFYIIVTFVIVLTNTVLKLVLDISAIFIFS